jgi:hypothetical protein
VFSTDDFRSMRSLTGWRVDCGRCVHDPKVMYEWAVTHSEPGIGRCKLRDQCSWGASNGSRRRGSNPSEAKGELL